MWGLEHYFCLCFAYDSLFMWRCCHLLMTSFIFMWHPGITDPCLYVNYDCCEQSIRVGQLKYLLSSEYGKPSFCFQEGTGNNGHVNFHCTQICWWQSPQRNQTSATRITRQNVKMVKITHKATEDVTHNFAFVESLCEYLHVLSRYSLATSF